MIDVQLVAKTDLHPNDLISHAAKTCYTSKLPKIGKHIDIENRLFKTGHHTTLQHNYFTFSISGLSISSVTFGLHLASPFYNTDQRSGRFSKMFNEPNVEELENYINHFWAKKINFWDKQINDQDKQEILDYLKKGIKLYEDNIEKAVEVAKDLIKEQRPFANEEYIKIQAPKFAQEQLRNFISTIFPTALDFTLDLSALCAMWRSAWNEELLEITNKMVEQVIRAYPELEYMFKDNDRLDNNWSLDFLKDTAGTVNSPELKLIQFNIDEPIKSLTKDGVDLLYFRPENMNNNINQIKTEIKLSVASFGQDQRHRTIKKSSPVFTGDFYTTPIMQVLGLEQQAKELMQQYIDLSKKLPGTLTSAIAPYGAVVSYTKSGDLNAIIHEQEKRLCWCTQEEIYNLSRLLREEIERQDPNHSILNLLAPHCYKGKCLEGVRFCGREVKSKEKFFPKRKV